MAAEFAYLMASLGRFFGAGSEKPIAGLDWNKLFELAFTHKVSPILEQVLRREAVPTPPDFRKALEAEASSSARFNLLLSAELIRILTLFDREKIPCIPVKGPVLNSSLYGSLALRVSTDLDFLVRREDVIRAKRALEASGFRLETDLHWPADSACFRLREHQLAFLDSSGAVGIDLHWTLLPGYFPSPLDEQDVWRHARPDSFHGIPYLALSREDLLLFLCAHGAKHLWERIGWLCDVARLIQPDTAIDWAPTISRAGHTGTSTMLALGILLTRECFAMPLPPALESWLAKQPRAAQLARSLYARAAAEAPIPVPSLEAARLSRQVLDRPTQWLALIAGSVVQPSEAEYRDLKLPPWLFGLYYPFRPLRVAVKHLLRPGQRSAPPATL